MTIKDSDKSFIKLIIRSRDTGDGWRRVSKTLWQLVDKFEAKELLETKDDQFVRLSEKGIIVAEYLT